MSARFYNADLGRLQTWTGTDWVPVRVSAGGNASQSGILVSAAGTYRVSAFVTISSGAAGSVSVDLSWQEETVQRNVNVVPTFTTPGGITNGDAFIVASGPVTYNVTATGFITGGYTAEIRAEAV